MAKTNFEPKVSTLGPNGTVDAPQFAAERVPAQNADAYSNSVADPYKALMLGRKAQNTTTPIEEMMGAMEGFAANYSENSNKSAVNRLTIAGLTADGRDFQVPVVPDLYKDILRKVPGLTKNMGVVIKKYREIEKLLTYLLRTINKAQSNQRMKEKMSTTEWRSVGAHEKDLKTALAKCQDQMNQAEALLKKHSKDKNPLLDI